MADKNTGSNSTVHLSKAARHAQGKLDSPKYNTIFTRHPHGFVNCYIPCAYWIRGGKLVELKLTFLRIFYTHVRNTWNMIRKATGSFISSVKQNMHDRMSPVIRPSDHPTIRPSDMAIRPSTIWTSDHPTIRPSDHLITRPQPYNNQS